METLVSTPVLEKTDQTIKLIDGNFSASEAADIINNILKVKINFHKLHRLSITEGNINESCSNDNSRIYELLEAQTDAKDFFKNLRVQGKTVKIKSTIQIAVED